MKINNMKSTILITNYNNQLTPLYPLFEFLASQNLELHLLSSCADDINYFKEQGWQYKKLTNKILKKQKICRSSKNLL